MNKVFRMDFIKKTAAVSVAAMILPHQILKGKTNNLSNDKLNIGGVGTVVQPDDNKKRLSFLNKPYPVIAGIISGQTPQELIAGVRNSESEGADGITIDLFDLKLEFRNAESFKCITDSVHLPFMFYFYREDKWKESSEDDRQEVLLAAADGGASMIDVLGDLYDPSPKEITYNKSAIDKQKRLIDKIHSKGADVVMSLHTGCYLSTEETLKHMLELESRGPDIVKIVTTINTEEELAEALNTTIALNSELKIPFIHLCSGKFSRPHRFMCPVLGTTLVFAVPYYSNRYPNLAQPTIKSMKAVLGSIRWNINDIKA
ncbi:type I 3-dehydroquinate dehydratase [Mariniphaga sediminis]|uniref:type I 3-dehydroquinate dehydratase n=1 Tax=Mariniphaga sediminis TaxID=1628158 RepID=UPI0035655E97